jgi:glycosyltransferase involved in cell wall biosynthesis
MVSGGELIVPSAYWDRIVEPVLADFETRFGRVVDHDALHESRQALRSLPSLPITPEHRDCSPWNVLVTTNGRLGFLDWESAEPAGLPVLDAVYYLSNATFFIDGTLRSGRERETYAKMLQPTTKTGRVFTEAMDLYCKKTGIDPSVVPILRRFTWMVHAAGEHDRIMSVQRELSADDAARRSTFLSLWLEEVRHARSDPRFLVPDAISAVRPRTAPTFSIVIPAYQAADVVADAVESALAQTVQPTEIIVCNDGSTDDIVAALAPYRGRITVINRENGGEAAAKNTGVRAATGEFVAILDADDIFLPRRLEALSELAAARPDLDLLTTDAFMVVNGRVARRCFTDTFPFPTDDQRKAILRNNFLPFAAVRRSAYLAVGGFDETLRRVPDWDCWLRMILEGAHAGFVNEPLAEYRLRATNITSDRVRVHQGLLETLDKARQRSDLSDEERRLVESGIAAHKRELEIRAARQAILDGTVDARRRCAGVVFGRGMSASARAKAAVAALLPRTARRFLTSRDRDVTEVAGRIRVHLD